MPVGFLASPYVCSSSDREPRAPVCPPVEAFIFQKTLLFIDPSFTWCFNYINSSWFCFLKLYFSVFQKIWHGAQCSLRCIESKSSRGRTQEFASLSVCLFLPIHLFFLSLSLSTPSSTSSPFSFSISLSFSYIHKPLPPHTVLHEPDSQAGALTLISQCPRV